MLPEAPSIPIGALQWKTAAQVAAAAGRRFVWVDDEISDIDRAWVGRHHRGRALLLHRVDPRSGLTEADLAEIGDWLMLAGRVGISSINPQRRQLCLHYNRIRTGLAVEVRALEIRVGLGLASLA
ncbi:hypothetical protein FHT44_006275 [Mycolicibacterium sp. BK634]|uniref:hypothetical protein n=1 Tax=Mycolicibacterium sp. BK634 TaxID=2587099 RepID=UPI001612D2D7|nr:hypothetical protein [Mycolicibacterium sp. BK634]MBB3753753.1 hypothetical protein [Mycolicibacterium sp. BK634]